MIARVTNEVTADPRSGSRHAGPWPHAILATVLAFAFWPLIQNPTWTVSGRGDLIHGHLPYRVVMADSVRNGHGLPNYDATAFGGIPLSADPQAGVTYPMNWLHALSSDGGAHWFGWLMMFHLWIAGIAVMWWLSGLGFPTAACLGGALALVLSGKWFHHVVASGQVGMLGLAWVPWQLGLIDRIGATARLRDAAWLAAATAMVILGSHPQLLLYTQYLVSGYAACVWLSSNGVARMRSLSLLVLSAVLALGLSAWYLMPILDEIEIFVRSDGLPRTAAAVMSLPPERLLRMILPIGPTSGRSSQVIFIGTAPIAIALCALLCARRRLAAIGFLGLLCLMVAYALGPNAGVQPIANEWLPGFSTFRIPPRVLLISGLPLAFLVAAGLTELTTGRPNRLDYGLAGALLFAGIGICAMKPTAGGVLAAAGLAFPAAAIAARLHVSNHASTGWLVWAGASIVAIQGLHFAAPLVQPKPPEIALATNAIAKSLRQPYGQGRVLGIDLVLGTATLIRALDATGNRLENLRGYNPLIPKATRELLAAVVGTTSTPMRREAAMIRTPKIANRTPLDLFNTQWIVSPRPLAVEGLTLRQLDGANDAGPTPDARRLVYENTLRMPRAGLVRRARAVADSRVALQAFNRRNPRRVVFVEDERLEGSFPGEFLEVPVLREGDRLAMDVDAGAGGYLVISELAHPGWHASVDEREATLHRANGYFLLLPVDAGQHAVELIYRPRSVQIGSALTGVSLLGCFGALVWHRRG
jgi:hypothetical protein